MIDTYLFFRLPFGSHKQFNQMSERWARLLKLEKAKAHSICPCQSQQRLLAIGLVPVFEPVWSIPGYSIHKCTYFHCLVSHLKMYAVFSILYYHITSPRGWESIFCWILLTYFTCLVWFQVVEFDTPTALLANENSRFYAMFAAAENKVAVKG